MARSSPPGYTEGSSAAKVNNDFYDRLGSKWFDDDEHAIALLRAETQFKVRYVEEYLPAFLLPFRRNSRGLHEAIVDVGCGAGLVALPLARSGWSVTGIDLSAPSLDIGRQKADEQDLQSLTFTQADAFALPFPHDSVGAVLLLDFLEHVEDPRAVIEEAARILAPGGLVFFHTFNRTLLSWLVAVKGISLITQECPENLHVWQQFLKPHELAHMLTSNGLRLEDLRGIRPCLNRGLAETALKRRVHPEFSFTNTRSLKGAYIGFATKEAPR